MQIVPVNPVGSQIVTISLGGQACQLNIYQKATGLYMDVLVNGPLIIGGVICQNINRIVRSLYLGFVGDFVWYDNLGQSDPVYSGLGSQYSLIYLEASDLPAGVG